MKIESATPGKRVSYTPGYGPGMGKEMGTVSSRNNSFVFVKFDEEVKRLTWDSTTSKACQPGDLTEEENG